MCALSELTFHFLLYVTCKSLTIHSTVVKSSVSQPLLRDKFFFGPGNCLLSEVFSFLELLGKVVVITTNVLPRRLSPHTVCTIIWHKRIAYVIF